MHALIGVEPDLTGAGEAKGAPRPQPFLEQIAHQAFAQIHLGAQLQPPLRDIQRQQPAGNDGEDDELIEKAAHVLALERVVEEPVPAFGRSARRRSLITATIAPPSRNSLLRSGGS
jgi:hypothetical protein